MRDREAGGETGGTGEHRLSQGRLNLNDLFGCRRPLVGIVTEYEQSQRGVADVGREVQPGAPSLDRRQVLGERGEVPRNAGRERCDIHVLDVLECAGDEFVMLGPRRRDRKPTVAGDDRGDAVVTRRRQCRIPEDLRVVMGVDVDEPRRHDLTRRVDHLAAVEVGTDASDAAVGDGDFGAPRGLTRAIYERAALDDHICAHTKPPFGHSPMARA